MALSQKKKRIIIAGDSGVIGSYIKHHLNSLNTYDILGLNSKNIDLADLLNIKNTFKNENPYDTLIFFIGLAHKKGTKKDFNAFEKTNFETLKNLLSTLKKLNKMPKKIIFSSTISVYGERYNTSHYDETCTTNPSSPYAITKLKAENYLNTHFKDISWVLRFSPVYSSTFSLNIDRRTRIKRTFYKTGSGSAQLSLCNIKNIGVAIEGILNNIVPNNTYNISDNQEYTYKKLLSYQKASRVITIPRIIFQIAYMCGFIFNNQFLKENSIKLLTNTIYPSKKIQHYVNLNYEL